MNRASIIAILIISTKLWSFGDTVPTTLFSLNIEYAGQIIKAQKYVDYITRTKEVLSIDTVSGNGDLFLSFRQKEAMLIHIGLGIYDAILFVEPGKKYEVVLPPLQPKTKGDLLNPFFKPVEVALGIKNRDSLDLNFQAAKFNNVYNEFVDKHYAQLFYRPGKAYVDTAINRIEAGFTNDTNTFFRNYRTYKYAWLRYVSYMRDSRYVIREYFHNKPFLYQNPAYMDLFNQIFTNYLYEYMNTGEGERLYSDIAFAKSPKYIKETFSNNMVLINDTLQELVLLKGLNDAFYQNNFPFRSLLLTLDSVAVSTKVGYHKTIAENIKHKALQSRLGYDAPKFELRDANGVFRSSSGYLANYVYLNFISVESFACQQDLELLKALYEKHKNDFRIVSICIDDNFTKAIKYFKDKGYDWMLLSYRTQKSIVDDYKVRVYPTYFLINPKGKLSMSPAPSPGEKFEWHFFKLLQGQKRNSNY